MTKLLKELEEITKAELDRCNEQHPLFASNHEGAAVLLEEIEEARDEMERIKSAYDLLWRSIKHDMMSIRELEPLRKHATLCAAECIQVAAMCEKFNMKEEEQE